MKRYMLLAGQNYESAYWEELFEGDFDTIEEAGNAVGAGSWFEIIDTDTKKVVEYGRVSEWLKAKRARE